MFALKSSIILFVYFSTVNVEGQLSAMFGNAIQADNCAEWTEWGPCIWLKGSPRWDRSYFAQLLPGRTGCRSHVFFKLLSERWGEAFGNFYNYLRDVTESEKQCGQCSYQQSCGRNCHRRGDSNTINPLFVAERRCEGVDQNSACLSKPVNGGCRLWPNHDIKLPNVTESMLAIVNGLDYLSCVPEQRSDGLHCRCCCHPFRFLVDIHETIPIRLFKNRKFAFLRPK